MLTIQHKQHLVSNQQDSQEYRQLILICISQTENIRKSDFEIECPVIKFVTYVT